MYILAAIRQPNTPQTKLYAFQDINHRTNWSDIMRASHPELIIQPIERDELPSDVPIHWDYRGIVTLVQETIS